MALNSSNIVDSLNYYNQKMPQQFSMIGALISQYVGDHTEAECGNDNKSYFIPDINNQDNIHESSYFDEIFFELGVDCISTPSPMPLNPSISPITIDIFILSSHLLLI